MVQRKRIRLITMRMQVRSLALLSGLRIQHCCELWCRLQMCLGSCVALAVARLAAVTPIRPLVWEPPYAAGVALEKAKRQKTKNKNTRAHNQIYFRTNIKETRSVILVILPEFRLYFLCN